MPTRSEITDLMRKVAFWQLERCDMPGTLAYAQVDPYASKNWIRACFLIGLSAYYRTVREPDILAALLERCEMNDWQLGLHDRFADDLCIAQIYLELYEEDPQFKRIAATRRALDAIVDQPMRAAQVGWRSHLNWDWADALYMAPPVFTRLAKVTGNPRYIEVMDAHWWDTWEILYDPSEQLYYRDIRFVVRPEAEAAANPIPWVSPHSGETHLITEVKRSAHGQKIFWGRGNGWVVGGLARLLDAMPADYPTRNRYEDLLRAMLERLAALQAADGFWRASLLDPEEYPNPETSSTSLIAFAFAWAIRHGVLDPANYLPVALKAWDALVSATDATTGKLGWVQPVGADPAQTTREDSHEYGTGSFLLAGCEISKLLD